MLFRTQKKDLHPAIIRKKRKKQKNKQNDKDANH